MNPSVKPSKEGETEGFFIGNRDNNTFRTKLSPLE
jgi:hypothetical protein